MAADQGTGTTIAFGTSAFHTGVTHISIGGGATRGFVPTSHLGTTTALTFEPEDLYDGGQITVTWDWDPGELAVTGGFLLGQAAETVTITFPNGTYAASMFCTAFDFDPVQINQRMQATATFKVTGAITPG